MKIEKLQVLCLRFLIKKDSLKLEDTQIDKKEKNFATFYCRII